MAKYQNDRCRTNDDIHFGPPGAAIANFSTRILGKGANVNLERQLVALGERTKVGVKSSRILFGQASVSSVFSSGEFEGLTITRVVEGLKNGKISPDQLPIAYLIKNEQLITFNNRSLLALRRAGLEPTILYNMSGDLLYERRLFEHLKNSQPSETIRVRGGPRGTSWIGQ